MNGEKIFTLAATLVGLATLTVLVTNGSGVKSAFGGIADAFSTSLKTAMGRN